MVLTSSDIRVALEHAEAVHDLFTSTLVFHDYDWRQPHRMVVDVGRGRNCQTHSFVLEPTPHFEDKIFDWDDCRCGTEPACLSELDYDPELFRIRKD